VQEGQIAEAPFTHRSVWRQGYDGRRAEIGAAFLCADLGIVLETRPDHAATIASWLKVLKDDKRVICTAARHAKKSADDLNGLPPTMGATRQPQDRGRPLET